MDAGFVGIGQMGHGMAQRLLEAGHRLTVWNRDAAKADAIVEQGAARASTPAEAAKAGIVFTMLANDAALEAVTEGEGGILSAGEGVLHVSCSTVSVALTRRLTEAHRAKGQRFVSAQVLGRPDAAAAGKLSIIAGGADEDLERLQPLFGAMGQKVLRMGAEPAMAAVSKLAANASIAAIIETLTEAYRIAGSEGVAAETMADFFRETDFGSRMMTVYGPLIATEKFEPAGFPLRLGRKDVGLALDAAGEGADIPFIRLLAARMDKIIGADGGTRDWAALGQPPKA
ncbi:NAD(P)-dependent oxidoreductase [Sphingomonas sp. PR090111-T3T-6A]|uniref:NAD(P)-dependent oxidoreductase n=1 Tax=Sphingomonas sp. PR090111-T3T-6A TaxID=685778 RepID=UPI00037473A9|nr:NAD(P)-dependent oxidoreductase [Sphingomonas sp. PR090111-T3T-6A]